MTFTQFQQKYKGVIDIIFVLMKVCAEIDKKGDHMDPSLYVYGNVVNKASKFKHKSDT